MNGSFEGTSEVPKLPGICKDTYIVNASTITFENTCFWTIEFDGTLVLYGDWVFNYSNMQLMLTNSLGAVYVLHKN